MTRKDGLLEELKEIIKQQEKEIAALKCENARLQKQTPLTTVVSDEAENISLKDIISHMPGSIYWKDITGKYLGCNDYMLKMCQLSSAEQIIGKKLTDLFAPEIAAQIEKNDMEVILTNETKHYEEKGINENAEPAFFLTEKRPLRNAQGRPIGLLGMSFDITERKKMEEDLKIAKEKAEASSRAKSQFLAIVNHELRTPLASIMGLLAILKRKKLTQEEQQKVKDDIENCTQYLLSLIDDVLDFSRLETGKYSLHHRPLNVPHLLADVFSILKPIAENKGIALKVECPEMTSNILTDARILKQILINLATNALKYTENGHVIIQAQAKLVLNDEMLLTISVTDTGKGIPKNKFDLIFEPFQQLEDAYTRQSSRSGTGLGLAIVKKLASLIDAKVEVKSKINSGSVFSICAQFKITKEKHFSTVKKTIKVKNKKTKSKIKAWGRPPHILLIEDDPIVQYIHKKMLEDLGCNVDVASSGLDAMQQLKHHDIVFVDISLPDISGFEVIKMIRENNHHSKRPIVALTAYNGIEEKTACLKAGANAFKNKPISQITLKKLLGRYLEQ